jgi:type VI protein secretion system component VasF
MKFFKQATTDVFKRGIPTALLALGLSTVACAASLDTNEDAEGIFRARRILSERMAVIFEFLPFLAFMVLVGIALRHRMGVDRNPVGAALNRLAEAAVPFARIMG